jgi:2,4'-dihydroxyacetophenone dioxygenase
VPPALPPALHPPGWPASFHERLVTDHSQVVNLFGWLERPIDFFDEQGRFVEQLDVWWFINHYETYCRAHAVPINEQLYL